MPSLSRKRTQTRAEEAQTRLIQQRLRLSKKMDDVFGREICCVCNDRIIGTALQTRWKGIYWTCADCCYWFLANSLYPPDMPEEVKDAIREIVK